MESNLEESFPIMRDTLQLQKIIKIKSNQLGEHMLFLKGGGGDFSVISIISSWIVKKHNENWEAIELKCESSRNIIQYD